MVSLVEVSVCPGFPKTAMIQVYCPAMIMNHSLSKCPNGSDKLHQCYSVKLCVLMECSISVLLNMVATGKVWLLNT